MKKIIPAREWHITDSVHLAKGFTAREERLDLTTPFCMPRTYAMTQLTKLILGDEDDEKNNT